LVCVSGINIFIDFQGRVARFDPTALNHRKFSAKENQNLLTGFGFFRWKVANVGEGHLLPIGTWARSTTKDCKMMKIRGLPEIERRRSG
jgi:hypothetical protein